MRRSRILHTAGAFGIAFLTSIPATASACAACFGQSDSPMAKGMNAGVFALLAVITSVLIAIALFFAYILRRAARLPSRLTNPVPAPFSNPPRVTGSASESIPRAALTTAHTTSHSWNRP
jgi:hypothetical protein